MSLEYINRVRNSGYRQHTKFLVRFITMPKELKYFNSPQVNVMLQEDDLHVHHSAPHHTSALITPFLKLFHWSLLVPDVIKFDKNKGEFYYKKGSFLSKVGKICNTEISEINSLQVNSLGNWHYNCLFPNFISEFKLCMAIAHAHILFINLL